MKNIENLTTPARERTSVPISGLDLSTPDDLVQDGKCETLHNMRYNANAWRPVHKLRGKTVTLSTGGSISGFKFTILYKHPVDNEGVYIARRKQKKEVSASKYIICRYDTSTQASTDIATFDNQPKISHFGNVLIINSATDSQYYLLKDGIYKRTTLPDCASTEVTLIDPSPKQAKFLSKTLSKGEMDVEELKDSQLVENWARAVYPLYNADTGESLLGDNEKYWVGEILLFVTYRMADGTNISPSPLHLIKTHHAEDKSYLNRRIRTIDYSDILGCRAVCFECALYPGFDLSKDSVPIAEATLRKASVAVRVRIPKDIDTLAVESVAIWATRINPVYRFDKNYIANYVNGQVQESGDPQSCYKDLDFNQPFYLFKELKLSDFSEEVNADGGYVEDYKHLRCHDIVLTGATLSNIIHNELYVPSNNVHQILNPSLYDYNRAAHFFGFSTKLCPPYALHPTRPTGERSRRSWVDVNINNKTYTTTLKEIIDTDVWDSSLANGYLLSYPDYRAKQYNIVNVGTFNLKPATAINYAYFHAPHTNAEKYPPIPKTAQNTYPTLLPTENNIVGEFSRIQVSAQNNCINLPFDRSYNFGDNESRILAMQSAAIKIGDEQVGALPLYVFTEEGIYALRAGESTLYDAVNPINHDRIINPSTISINGAVVYITERGVHILTGEGSKVISTPIHNADGIPDIDFLKSCVFLAPKQFNEIVLLDGREAGTKTHYVYNLDYGYWSTRDLNGTKINTDELVDNTNGVIYNIDDEDERIALDCKIKTRPIKLGNVDYKRLETIIPRMRTTNDSIELGISLEASNDGRTYANLYKTDRPLSFSENINNPLVIRRVPFSAKYFKLQLNLISVNEDEFATSITHIDIEWYRRFSRRMR